MNEPVDMRAHHNHTQYVAQHQHAASALKPYQSGPWGAGNISQNSSGDLPLYNNDEQRLPGYTGSLNFSDESLKHDGEHDGYGMEDLKNPFDDMKV